MMKGYSKLQIIQYLVNKKLIKEIGGVYYPTDRLEAIVQPASDPKEELKEFCVLAEIPFQVSSPTGGKYTVKYITDKIAKSYLEVLKKVEKEDLIRVTKRYYKETSFPVTIKNYFELNIWQVALEQPELSTGTSFNKFED